MEKVGLVITNGFPPCFADEIGTTATAYQGAADF